MSLLLQMSNRFFKQTSVQYQSEIASNHHRTNECQHKDSGFGVARACCLISKTNISGHSPSSATAFRIYKLQNEKWGMIFDK